MSEREPEVRRFDDGTPESVVVRYGWNLDVFEKERDPDVDGMYSTSLLHLKELYDVSDKPRGLTFETVAAFALPKEYSKSGLLFTDWCEMLRLAPMRMLYKGVPEIDSLSPKYMHMIYFSTFSPSPRHGAECMSVTVTESNRHQCRVAAHCPARATKEIVAETGRLLAVRRYVHEGEESPDLGRRTAVVLDEAARQMEKYGIMTAESFRGHINYARDRSQAFFSGEWTPETQR